MKSHIVRPDRSLIRGALSALALFTVTFGANTNAEAALQCWSYHVDGGACGELCGMKCQASGGGYDYYGMDCGADIFQGSDFDINVTEPCNTGISAPTVILDAVHHGTLISGLSNPKLAVAALRGAGVEFITGRELNEYLASQKAQDLPPGYPPPTAVIRDEVAARMVVVRRGGSELNKANAAFEKVQVTWDVDPLRLSRGVIRHCGDLMKRLSESICAPEQATTCGPRK